MDNSLISFESFWRSVRAYPPLQVITELILIGAVVYWIIRFLRGTRGARMLKGVAFVLISLYLIVRLVGTQLHVGAARVAIGHHIGGAVGRRETYGVDTYRY